MFTNYFLSILSSLVSSRARKTSNIFIHAIVSKFIALNFVSRFKICLEIFGVCWMGGMRRFCLHERRVFLLLRVFEFIL